MKVFEAHKLFFQVRSMCNRAMLVSATDKATPMRKGNDKWAG